MFFGKFLKITILNLVFTATFISFATTTYSRNYQTGEVSAGETVAGLVCVAGAAAVCVGLACLKTHLTYKNAKNQLKVLQEFNENPNLTYENLKNYARNLYYSQSWGPSSTSLESDYPVIWLEKAATSNKNILGVISFLTFNEKLSNLSKNLGEKLNFLRNCDSFIYERKEYNEKLREQSYRESKLSLEQQKLELERQRINNPNGRPTGSGNCQCGSTVVISVK